MKNFIYSFISAAALLAFFACASADGGADREDQADRVPSGRIVIYTSMYQDVIESLDWALQRQFPNADIVFAYGGTGQIKAKVAAERASGRLGGDILLVAEPSYSLELKEAGMLHPFVSRSAAALAFDFDERGYWYPVRISNMVLAFNPEKSERGSLPNSFYAFANDPSLRGAIAMSNPLVSGTTKAAITALLDKYGQSFFEALGRQNVAIESAAIALSRLESGDHKMIMVLEESVLRKRQEEMSRLEIIYPTDGTIIIPSTIMIVAEEWSANRNTRTAEIIADWFLSPEGQAVIVDGWMHS
ncbi:MAG: ABC transporter substrate-binding protein, partial [Treponema sp.]|nr:ABC transporter substrate-binding protein [Treponema sp.]